MRSSGIYAFNLLEEMFFQIVRLEENLIKYNLAPRAVLANLASRVAVGRYFPNPVPDPVSTLPESPLPRGKISGVVNKLKEANRLHS